MSAELIPVTSMEAGEEGIIQSISGGRAFASRLAGMGIIHNTKLKILRKSGGLVIVQVAETRVALGSGEASKILAYKIFPSREDSDQIRSREKLLVALAGQPNVGK